MKRSCEIAGGVVLVTGIGLGAIACTSQTEATDDSTPSISQGAACEAPYVLNPDSTQNAIRIGKVTLNIPGTLLNSTVDFGDNTTENFIDSTMHIYQPAIESTPVHYTVSVDAHVEENGIVRKYECIPVIGLNVNPHGTLFAQSLIVH